MSEQWTIEDDTGSELTVRAPNGFGVELDANSADPRERFAYFAIRQQARDIAELEVLAEIGRQWNTDSSLAKWFPLTAERVEQDAREVAKLRADLAAAVSATQFEQRNLARCSGINGELRKELAAAVAARANMDTDRLEWITRAEQAESRLAAIDAAPTMAWLCTADDGLSDATVSKDVRNIYAKSARVIVELIARPAKD